MTVTASGLPAFGSLTAPTFSFTPTAVKDLGISTVTASVCDGGNLCATYSFTVSFTNSAPVFATSSSNSVSVALNSVGTFNLPAATDPDGDTVTITKDLSSFSVLNAGFSGSTLTISPISFAEVGSYSVTAQACDW